MTADNPDVQERKRKLKDFLEDCFSEFQRSATKQGKRRPTQAAFVRWLGVQPTNFSGWINMDRLPQGENADKLATKLGLEIYDILGLPPRIPKDKKLLEIFKRWGRLNTQQQAQIAEEVQNLADKNGKNSIITDTVS